MEMFTIMATPIGKGRPRFVKCGKFTRAYTPKKTADYEAIVRASYHGKKYSGPLSVSIYAFFPIPKSTTKKRRLEILNKCVSPQTKPDIDNIAKSILDGLNGVAYDDDKQIVNLDIHKCYTAEADGKSRVYIKELKENDNVD